MTEKKVLIRMPENKHTGLKIRAAKEKTTLNNLILSAIDQTYPGIS